MIVKPNLKFIAGIDMFISNVRVLPHSCSFIFVYFTVLLICVVCIRVFRFWNKSKSVHKTTVVLSSVNQMEKQFSWFGKLLQGEFCMFDLFTGQMSSVAQN